jgi:hypothetical protein
MHIESIFGFIYDNSIYHVCNLPYIPFSVKNKGRVVQIFSGFTFFLNNVLPGLKYLCYQKCTILLLFWGKKGSGDKPDKL